MRTTIYGLFDINGRCRYIGRTTHPVQKRMAAHLCRSRKLPHNNTHLCCWIRRCLMQGYTPTIKPIDEVDGDGHDAECFWIWALKVDCKRDLTNGTDGGDGLVSPTAETRRKMSLSQLGKKRGPQSEQHRQSIAAAKTGKTYSAQHRKAISDSLKGKAPSAHNRQRSREANTGEGNPMFGKKHTEESLEKMRAAKRAWWAEKRKSA